jgi:N-methylhydantoinase B
MPPQIPACAGSFRSIKLTAPKGCLVNANYPAAVAAGNVETSTRLVDVVLGALAKALPEKIPAASHGSMNNIAMGANTASLRWDYYETLAGGMGAGANGAGLNAVQTHMTNTLNTPIEVLEKYYPLRITRYEIRQNSGGKGKHNGGDGLIREYEFLQSTSVTLLTERRDHAPWGLSGGGGGKKGKNLINDIAIPAKSTNTLLKGDRLTVCTAGGGAWGDPTRGSQD